MTSKIARAAVTPLRQRSQYTCMAASMSMCLRALGHDFDEDTVNRVMGAAPMKGAAWEQALATAQHFGCRATLTMPSTIEQLKAWTDAGIPVMIAWNPEGRPWSHASVVFDVDDKLNVYVADPNIPNPKETVRVVSEDDFYHKWFEQFPDYLVRRPACAIEREVTADGKQVKPKTASTKTASTKRANYSRWLTEVPGADQSEALQAALASLEEVHRQENFISKNAVGALEEFFFDLGYSKRPFPKPSHWSMVLSKALRFDARKEYQTAAASRTAMKDKTAMNPAEEHRRDIYQAHESRWDAVAREFGKHLSSAIAIPQVDVTNLRGAVMVNVGPLFGIRHLSVSFQFGGSTVPNPNFPPSFSVMFFPPMSGYTVSDLLDWEDIERSLLNVTFRTMARALSPFGKVQKATGSSRATPGRGVVVRIPEQEIEHAWDGIPQAGSLLGRALTQALKVFAADFLQKKEGIRDDIEGALDDARKGLESATISEQAANASGDTESADFYSRLRSRSRLEVLELTEQLDRLSKMAKKNTERTAMNTWNDPHKSPAGMPYPKSRWDSLGRQAPFRWSTPAAREDGSFPEPWRVTDKDAALAFLKKMFPQIKDIYVEYMSEQFRGQNLLWVGLRDNRDKDAHTSRLMWMSDKLSDAGLPSQLSHQNVFRLVDDIPRDILREKAGEDRMAAKKGPTTAPKTLEERNRDKNKVKIDAPAPRNDAARALAEMGNRGQGKHKNKQDFDRGRARKPKHPGKDREASLNPEMVMTNPFRGYVNDAFIERLKSHPELRHLITKVGARFTLVMADFFNDPTFDGGSEYDVDFRQVEPDKWTLMVGAQKGPQILNTLKGLLKVRQAAYSGNPDGKPIYDVAINHGENQALSGGHDVMKRLQDQYRIEQGNEPREPNPRLARWNANTPESVKQIARVARRFLANDEGEI